MPVRKYWTLAQMRAKINRDMDLQAETFVSPAELIDYFNEAIDECEAEIHSLQEDYFFTRQKIDIIEGQESYTLPDNIYGHKIRRVVWVRQGEIYKVARVQPWKLPEAYAIAKEYDVSTHIFRYFVENPGAGAPVITFMPTPDVSGQFAEIWYLRQANRLEQDSDICDIPEFINFIFQFVKVRVYEKEGHPNAGQARADLQAQRVLMQGTLASAQPDAENLIEPDLTLYEEMN